MRATIKATFVNGQTIKLEYDEVDKGSANTVGIQIIAFMLSGLLQEQAVTVEVSIRPPDSANGSH